MLVSIRCNLCKDKPNHHDHFECSECGKRLGGMTLSLLGMKYCPYCGTFLDANKIKWDMKKKDYVTVSKTK